MPTGDGTSLPSAPYAKPGEEERLKKHLRKMPVMRKLITPGRGSVMRNYLCAGVALALTLVLAACGGSAPGSAANDAGSPKPYPELRWGSPPTTSIDSTTHLETSTLSYEALAVQNLMEFEQDGKIKPGLAASVKHPNATTYIYDIRKDIKFSDGRPLTATDVVYSLMRNLGKESQTASSYADVASISEDGPLVVIVRLKRPSAIWPDIPAYAGQIIEKAAAEKVAEGKIGTPSGLPVGTGPWKIDSFNPTVGIRFSRNPYWAGPTPPAARIDVAFFKEEAAEALALRSGAIDGVLPIVDVKAFTGIPGTHLVAVPGTSSGVISMDTQTPPFNNIHVRRAIAYATDVKGMLKATWGRYAVIDRAIVPASLFTNVASSGKVNAMLDSLPRYEFNLATAKQELEKSPYPHGFTTTIQTEVSDDNGTVVSQILASDLAKIGINAKVDNLAPATFLSTIYGPRKNIKLMPVEYASAFSDPDALMDFWLAPEAAKANGLNSGDFVNAEVAKLLKQEDTATSSSERFSLISKILRISMEEVPYQPQYSPDYVIVLSNKFVYPTFATTTILSTPWAMGVKPAK